MEENNNIDKDLQQLRDRFEMNPPENAWDLLDADLERKQAIMYKRSRNKFKVLSICLALLLVPFIAFYCNYTASTTLLNTKNDYSNRKEDNQNILKPGIRISKQQEEINSKIEKTNQSGEAEITKISTKKEENTKNKETVESKKKEIIVENKENNINQYNIDNEYLTKNNIEKKAKGVIVENQIKLRGNKESKLVKKLKQEPKLAITKLATGEETKKKEVSYKAEETQKDESDNLQSNKKIEKETASNNFSKESNADSSNKQNLVSIHTSETIVKADSTLQNTAKDAAVVKNIKKIAHWSVAVFYTPNYYTGFRMTRNTAVRSYGYNPNDYSQSEKNNYSYATGLLVNYYLNKRFGISLGTTYSTIAYSMALPTIYVRYGANRQLKYIYPTPCGNIEMPNPNNTTLHYGDSIKTTTSCAQVVKILSVPLLIKLQQAKNNWKLYVEGGLSANFVLQEKADVAIGSQKTTIINNINGLQNMNYSYLFSAGIEYDINKRLSASVAPSFKGSLTSLTQKTAYYCYPFTVNLNTGITYHFATLKR